MVSGHQQRYPRPVVSVEKVREYTGQGIVTLEA